MFAFQLLLWLILLLLFLCELIIFFCNLLRTFLFSKFEKNEKDANSYEAMKTHTAYTFIINLHRQRTIHIQMGWIFIFSFFFLDFEVKEFRFLLQWMKITSRNREEKPARKDFEPSGSRMRRMRWSAACEWMSVCCERGRVIFICLLISLR